MIIERLEVRGGFLDGLDLAFGHGLNVLIGPRGAGKTSVLELVRFVLGVPAMTSEAQVAADQQARAVLGDGTASVFCSVQGQELVLMRTSLDDAPAASARFHIDAPLIVSQNEIEAIGLDPVSRRSILDRLVDSVVEADVTRGETRDRVLSLQRQIENLRSDREALRDKAASLVQLPQLLEEAEKQQAVAAANVEQARPLQEAVAAQADELGRVRSMGDAYRIAEEALRGWRLSLAESKLSQPLPKLPVSDVGQQVADAVAAAQRSVGRAVDQLASAEQLVATARTTSRSTYERLQTELKARTEQLESVQQGAGEQGRRVSALRQQLAERDAITTRVQELDSEIEALVDLRRVALDDLERTSDELFETRRRRAADLTSEFSARIEVRVDKAAETSEYESALADALQGSNLQYKSLASQIAEKMGPRELVAAVEAGDPSLVVGAAGVTAERATRLVSYLSGQPLGNVLSSHLEDTVDFALLDGQDYKVTRHLSMGQRCTIVLPLLLAESREAILLDQPEDHLDNAFIVETLVQAIRERSDTGQVIVATHNANVPVLGDARRVVVLASNGRQGFVSNAGPLDDDSTVQAITTLMEGGREAFARRAAFYHSHPAKKKGTDGRTRSGS
jgi:ABC-type branched-subunit amino acid transport system ATPase component